jgi:hypothetical protein
VTADINRGAPARWTDGVLHASGNLLTADADGIKTSFATQTVARSLALADFNGAAVVNGALAAFRVLSLTGAGAGAFVDGSKARLTARDFLSRPFVQDAAISGTDGGTFLWTVPIALSLAQVTIDIDAQADTDGTWTVGVRASKVVDADWLLGVTEGTASVALVDALTNPFTLPISVRDIPASVAVVHSITSAEFLAMRASAR